jgi:hypothetical protein
MRMDTSHVTKITFDIRKRHKSCCALSLSILSQGCVVLSAYGLDIKESCFTCKLGADRLFCDLPTGALQAFESIK